MRRLIILLLSLTCSQAFGIGTDKDTLFNTRYQETAASRAAQTFHEAEVPLPAFPNAQSQWAPIFISTDYLTHPEIDLTSITIAPDNTVRYILNKKSSQGYNNLTAEGFFCSTTSLSMADDNKSKFKIYAYGDNTNHHWIEARKAQWQLLGPLHSTDNKIHAQLYRAFCEDGMPESATALQQRAKERLGKFNNTLINSDK